MSFKTFLHHLRHFKGIFVVRAWGFLRTPDKICPVSAVCNALHGTSYSTNIGLPAKAMGMSRRLAWRIANAADARGRELKPLERNYRNRMLRALKLREVP